MPIKVGVAGLRRGRGPAAVMANHPLATVAAVADPVAATREQVAADYQVPVAVDSFEALLELELDAVFIATPVPLHARQAVAALDRGLHVLSEVPAVVTIEEGQALVAAAARATGSYMMAENVNWFPRTVAWRRFIDEGKLGEIFYAEAEYVHDCRALMRNPDGSPTWRAGGSPIRYCTHSLGPLLHWMQDRCVSVVGFDTGCHLERDFGTVDMEVALFKMASGAVCKVLCGFSVASEPGRHNYTLYGSGGMLDSGRAADAPDRGYLAAEPATRGPATNVVPPLERPAPEAARLGGHGDAEWFMVDAWLTALTRGEPVPIDVHAALDMTLPGICAHTSAQQGGAPVAIPNSRDWSRA